MTHTIHHIICTNEALPPRCSPYRLVLVEQSSESSRDHGCATRCRPQRVPKMLAQRLLRIYLFDIWDKLEKALSHQGRTGHQVGLGLAGNSRDVVACCSQQLV